MTPEDYIRLLSREQYQVILVNKCLCLVLDIASVTALHTIFDSPHVDMCIEDIMYFYRIADNDRAGNISLLSGFILACTDISDSNMTFTHNGVKCIDSDAIKTQYMVSDIEGDIMTVTDYLDVTHPLLTIHMRMSANVDVPERSYNVSAALILLDILLDLAEFVLCNDEETMQATIDDELFLRYRRRPEAIPLEDVEHALFNVAEAYLYSNGDYHLIKVLRISCILDVARVRALIPPSLQTQPILRAHPSGLVSMIGYVITPIKLTPTPVDTHGWGVSSLNLRPALDTPIEHYDYEGYDPDYMPEYGCRYLRWTMDRYFAYLAEAGFKFTE